MSDVQVMSSRKEQYTWQCSRCSCFVKTQLSNSPTHIEVLTAGVDFDCDQAAVNAVHAT